jgi:hypothetical protein
MKRLVAIAFAMFALIAGLATPAAAGGDSMLPDGKVSLMAGPCGSSYSWIGNYKIPSSGTTYAEMNVYWSSSTKRNCLTTNHAGSTYGVSLFTQARIRPSGSSWPSCPSSTGCDAGFYKYRAGPVYTPAGVNMSGRCIDINGVIDWRSRTVSRIACG